MLFSYKILHMVIIFSIQKYGNSNNLTQCYPAEEGTKHTIHFWFYSNTAIKKFRIENPNSLVTECSTENLSCGNEFSKKVLSVLEKNRHYYHLNITILNVTRYSEFNIEGRWTLTNLQNKVEFRWCYVKIYAKPSNITCESYMVETLFHLKCSIERIYPNAKCLFLTNNTEMNKHISTLAVNYTPYNETVKPLYYRSSCAIVLSKSNFGNGIHDVLVTVYPNVTGNDTDLFFGTNITHKIDLGQPGVALRECPQVIEVGENISCLCETSHLSLTDLSIDWFEENQQKTFNGSKVLQFKVTKNSINYKCEKKNMKGNSKATAFYRPKVYIRPFNFTCLKLQTDKLVISCNTLGVYPEPRCLLIAYDSTGHVKLKNEALTRNNEIQLENITQYQSACNFNISDSLMNEELRVVVTMYPNVTGIETDLTFGANATVTLERIETMNTCLGENCSFLSYIISVTIMAALLPVILLACFACLYKNGVLVNVWPFNRGQRRNNGEHTQRPSCVVIGDTIHEENNIRSGGDNIGNVTDEIQDSSNLVQISGVTNGEHDANNPDSFCDKENIPEKRFPIKLIRAKNETADEVERTALIRKEDSKYVASYSKSNNAVAADENSQLLLQGKPTS